MKVELTHYTELCYEGEAKRTGVVVFDNDKVIDFKTKGETSLSLRACGLDLSCLRSELVGFNDFSIDDTAEIIVGGVEAVNSIEFHSQEWWVNRVGFWKNMISENSVVVEKVEKIAQKDWTNDERNAIRTSREAVKHAQGNLKIAESKIK